MCPLLSPLITCIDLWAYQCNQNIELFSHQNDLAHTPLTTIVSPTSPPLPQLVLRLYSPFLYFQYFKVQFPSVVTHTYNPSTQAEPGVKYIQHGWARQCYPVSKTNSGTPSSPPEVVYSRKGIQSSSFNSSSGSVVWLFHPRYAPIPSAMYGQL